MIGLFCFVLAILVSPFKSTLRLEAENAVAASKAAPEHPTRCWALELAPLGVRVNAIAAGPTESGALLGMMGLSPQQAEAIKEQERARSPLGRRRFSHTQPPSSHRQHFI